jgi:ribosomal protein S18 acetylase RimI-like enzyme
MLYDGWVLRFARGYTKRANSVNPLYPSRMAVGQKVRQCEEIYAAKGLPSIFRLTSFAAPAGLDELLAERGYRKLDTTLVLSLELRGWATPEELGHGTVCDEALDDWLSHFGSLLAQSATGQGVHREILEAIPSRRYLVSRYASAKPVSCGVGVLDGGFVGLFDVVTHPDRRNEGHATALVTAVLRRARRAGASHAYLSVVLDNQPARCLYDKLGFEELYRYWYRIGSH